VAVDAAETERRRALETALTLKVRCVGVTDEASLAFAQAMPDPLDEVNRLADRYGGGRVWREERAAANERSYAFDGHSEQRPEFDENSLVYEGDLSALVEMVTSEVPTESMGVVGANGDAGEGVEEGRGNGGGSPAGGVKSWGGWAASVMRRAGEFAALRVSTPIGEPEAADATVTAPIGQWMPAQRHTANQEDATGASAGVHFATCSYRAEVAGAGPPPPDCEAWRFALNIVDKETREDAHRIAVKRRRDADQPQSPCLQCLGGSGCGGKGSTGSKRVPHPDSGGGGSGGDHGHGGLGGSSIGVHDSSVTIPGELLLGNGCQLSATKPISGGDSEGEGTAVLLESLSLPEDSLPIWGPTADDVNPAVIGPKRCAALA